jgi:hypothetical protein
MSPRPRAADTNPASSSGGPHAVAVVVEELVAVLDVMETVVVDVRVDVVVAVAVSVTVVSV